MLNDTLLHGGALHGQTHVAQGHLAADSLTGSRDIPQRTVPGKVPAPRQPVASWELQKNRIRVLLKPLRSHFRRTYL